jgi:hypothetical protein
MFAIVGGFMPLGSAIIHSQILSKKLLKVPCFA